MRARVFVRARGKAEGCVLGLLTQAYIGMQTRHVTAAALVCGIVGRTAVASALQLGRPLHG